MDNSHIWRRSRGTLLYTRDVTHLRTPLVMALVLAATPALGHADPASCEPQLFDAGLFTGGSLVGDELELGNSYAADQVPQSALLLGLRGAYIVLPSLVPGSALDPALAVEFESRLALSSTAGTSGTADMPGARRESYFAPVVGWRMQARLSMWSRRPLSPFVVLGAGGETVLTRSPFVRSGDSDAELHWGVGATYRMGPHHGLRADLRHGITAGRTQLATSTAEVHVGLYFAFELAPPGAGSADRRAGDRPGRAAAANRQRW